MSDRTVTITDPTTGWTYTKTLGKGDVLLVGGDGVRLLGRLLEGTKLICLLDGVEGPIQEPVWMNERATDDQT